MKIHPNSLKNLVRGYMKGRKHKEKTKELMRKKAKEYISKLTLEERKQRTKNANATSVGKFKKGHTPWSKGMKGICFNTGRTHFKKRHQWSKEIKEKQIKNMLKSSHKRPTNLEKGMIEIIKKRNLPYRYTGNGKFLIDGLCPDFININGEKIAIEVYSSYYKNIHYGSVESYKNKRIKRFSKFGWKIVFLDEIQLNNEKLVLDVLKI